MKSVKNVVWKGQYDLLMRDVYENISLDPWNTIYDEIKLRVADRCFRVRSPVESKLRVRLIDINSEFDRM